MSWLLKIWRVSRDKWKYLEAWITPQSSSFMRLSKPLKQYLTFYSAQLSHGVRRGKYSWTVHSQQTFREAVVALSQKDIQRGSLSYELPPSEGHRSQRHQDLKYSTQQISSHQNHRLRIQSQKYFHLHSDSTNSKELSSIYCGTPTYMSPEIVNRKPHCPLLADRWSLGILLYNILHGHCPFKAQNQK